MSTPWRNGRSVWLQRQPPGGAAGPRRWLGPAVMAVLYFLTLGLLLWSAQRHDLLEHGRDFDSDVGSALHSLGLHLRWGLESLPLVGAGFWGAVPGDGGSAFRERAAVFAEDHPGIVAVLLADKDLVVRSAISRTGNETLAGSRLSFDEAHSVSRWAVPAHGEVPRAWFEPNVRRATLDAYVPLLDGSQFLGVIGAAHSCQHLLNTALPPHVLAKSRVSLLARDGSVVCATSGPESMDPRFARDSELVVWGNTLHLRLEHYRSDLLSREMWLLVLVCFVLTLGTAHGMRSLSREAGDRERAEKAVRRERDNLRNVLEAMEDGVAVVSPDLAIQYVNPALVRDFGPYEGRKCYEYFHGGEVPCSWCMMDSVVAGEAVHTEWCYPRNNRTYDLIDSRITNPDGNVAKLKIFRDITERLQAEEVAREEGRLRLAESESLRRVTTALLQNVKSGDVLGVVCQEAQRLTGARGSGVSMVEGDALRVTRWTGEPPAGTERAPLEGSFGGLVVKAGEPVLANDLRAYDLACYRDPRPENLLAVPLRVGGVILGVLDVVDGATGFAEDDIRILSQFADQAAVAIENARLKEEAERGIVIEERQRLAHELHDSVTQALYSIALFADAARMALDRGQTDVGKSHLDQLRELSREAMRELRLLIFELHPPALEKEGLGGALRTRLATVETRAGLQTQFTVEGAERPLPPPVEQALYRVAQEALNNVVKHAKAHSVDVCVSYGESWVGLRVGDDGVGFDSEMAAREKGLGVVGMRERLQSVGGELRWESAPSHGTMIIARVPLAAAGEG